MYHVFVLQTSEMTDAQFNRRMRKTACPVVWKGHGVQLPVTPSDQSDRPCNRKIRRLVGVAVETVYERVEASTVLVDVEGGDDENNQILSRQQPGSVSVGIGSIPGGSGAATG